MTTLTTADLVNLPNNPISGFNYLIDQVEQNWFDQATSINSGTHPAIFCADLTVSMTYSFLNSLSDAISEVFPEHARSISELSRNMNNEQMYGLFGNPAVGTVNFVIALNNLIAYAPAASDTINSVTLNYQKLLVPKDTVFDVAGYQFSIENGIEIRYNERTGVSAVYDSTTNNPFNAIAANVLAVTQQTVDSNEYVILTVPVRQLSITTKDNISSTASAGAGGNIQYTDNLYGVRAFITQNGVKTEISVTYDKAVFDPGICTLTVSLGSPTVANGNINNFDFAIPDVYIENGLGIGDIQIAVYTTKGNISKDFTDVDPREYAVSYQDMRYRPGVLSAYSSPLVNMGGIVWKFTTPVDGGNIPTSFDTIKYGVVTGKRQQTIPITENNLQGSVQAFGYSAIKTIEYVTKRLYALTKELPLQTNKNFYSGVSAMVGSNLISAQGLVNTGMVYDNNTRITIPSGVMFDVTDSVPIFLTKQDIDAINALSNNQLIARFGTNSYCYLPFHSVLDMTNSQASLRTYYLDNPTMGIQSFRAENTNLGITVGINASTISYENDSYVVRVETTSDDNFKNLTADNIAVQMSVITNSDDTQWASMKGVLDYMTSDGEFVYKFILDTNFDVDENDILYINNMSQYGAVQVSTGINLSQDLVFVFMSKASSWVTVIDADSHIDRSLYATPYSAIIETRVTAKFGSNLSFLYNRVRPLIGAGQYQKYLQDVPETYTQDEYEKANGELVFGDDGKPILIGKAGTPVYNSDGSVSLLHRAGDYIKDANDNFISLLPRNLSYHWDFVGFDGVYKLSQDDYDITFAQSIKDYIANTTGADLALFNQAIIDQTSLVYQPRNKMGYKKMVVNSNYENVLRQDLTFEITYYLTKAGFNNANLRATLKTNSPMVINNYLYNNSTVGISSLVQALLTNTPAEVLDVKINALSGDTTVDVISSSDALSGFSIHKKLALGNDKLPTIVEDVSTDFLLHDASAL